MLPKIFVSDFKDLVDTEGFIPEHVFICDETGLLWKKLLKRIYITMQEKALPGHKLVKDRLTLLLCGHASGDFKIKPLIVYTQKTPEVLRKALCTKTGSI
jgi:hypothetical protein